MRIAPIIPSALEFFDYENESILVEINQEDEILDLLCAPLSGKVILIFSPTMEVKVDKFDSKNTAVIQINSVYETYKIIKSLKCSVEYIILNRVDEMDTHLEPKERGAQQCCYIGMLASPKILRGCNLIVSSSREEKSIKSRVTKHLNLKHH